MGVGVAIGVIILLLIFLLYPFVAPENALSDSQFRWHVISAYDPSKKDDDRVFLLRAGSNQNWFDFNDFKMWSVSKSKKDRCLAALISTVLIAENKSEVTRILNGMLQDQSELVREKARDSINYISLKTNISNE